MFNLIILKDYVNESGFSLFMDKWLTQAQGEFAWMNIVKNTIVLLLCDVGCIGYFKLRVSDHFFCPVNTFLWFANINLVLSVFSNSHDSEDFCISAGFTFL